MKMLWSERSHLQRIYTANLQWSVPELLSQGEWIVIKRHQL